MVTILNGPVNSGKSTLAKLIAQKVPNTAIVEVDTIREFLPIEGSSAWEICFRASVQLVEGFVREGLNVVFVYHLSKNDFEFIKERINKYDVDLHAFTLKPNIETLVKNRGDRQLNEYLLDKIRRTYDSEKYSGEFGIVIDNSDQTPEQTLDKILHNIGYAY